MSSTVYYLGITLFFISCSPKYQIYSLDSDDVKYVRSEYLYEDSVLEFTYDFWADGGTMLYNIFNKSGDSIFINMERSNFRFNQEPFHYYLNQSTGTLAKPDTSNNLSYSPYLDFDPIVTIPPRQDRWFEGFPVTTSWRKSKKKQTNDLFDLSELFNHENTPIKIQNIIYYRINQSPLERCHIHQFWVASFEECTKDQLQIMASSNVPRKNYFFVSKKISRDHQQTWLDMGLGLLEVMTALF